MTEPAILQNATREQLVQAAALNHQELFCLSALAAGGEVQEAEGVTWTYADTQGDSMIAFPTLSADSAGVQLDEIATYYLRHVPKGLVGCWSLDPPQPADLGARLLARGFQVGWRPCWMALDLRQVQSRHQQPEGLRVRADNVAPLDHVQDLPFANTEDASAPSLAQQYPGRAQRFIAILNGKVVGQSVVLLTTGPYGAAGIYDVGVVPEARNQGIGKAVTQAACLYAQERGALYAVLNATDMGRRIYGQLGFEWLGDGWTWWLNVPRLAAHPPTQDQIALAEAIGRGDIDALDHLGARLNTGELQAALQAPLTNEMTLMQLAVHCRQPASAEWLAAHGVTLDVLAAWDLGWRERAAQILARDPGQANQRFGEMKITLLHEAASRGDTALAQLALSAHPDLNAQDEVYKSTALGWARHFQQAEIIQLIEEHQAE